MTDIKKIFDTAEPPALPQSQFRDWAYNKSLREILDECNREDWLLWVLSKTLGIESNRFIYLKAKLADVIKYVLNDDPLILAIEAGILYGNNLISYDQFIEKKEVAQHYQKYLSINSAILTHPDYIKYAIQSMASRWIYDDQGYSMYRLAIELLNDVDSSYPKFHTEIKPIMLNIIRENTKDLN